MLETYVNDVKRWLAAPYKENGTVIDWFLFVGLLTISGILWAYIIKRVAD